MGGSVASKLTEAFSPELRQRGEDLFYRNLVEVVPGKVDRAEATVFGNGECRVVLWPASLDGDGDGEEELPVRGACNCSTFCEEGVCEHLWGLILSLSRCLPEVPISSRFDFPPLDDLVEGTTLKPASPLASPELPSWVVRLDRIETELHRSAQTVWSGIENPGEEILYSVDVEASEGRSGLALLTEVRLRSGGKTVPYDPEDGVDSQPTLVLDRRIFACLQGATRPGSNQRGARPYFLDADQLELLLPMLCETDRLHLKRNTGEDQAPPGPLSFDGGSPWVLGIRMQKVEFPAAEDGGVPVTDCIVEGFLSRDQERQNLSWPSLLCKEGFLFSKRTVARFDPRGCDPWLDAFRDHGPLRVPGRDEDELIRRLLALPGDPLLDLPELSLARATKPRPFLQVIPGSAEEDGPGESVSGSVRFFCCRIAFDYDGTLVSASRRESVLDASAGSPRVRRDRSAERAALILFLKSGGRRLPEATGFDGEIEVRRLPEVTARLLGAGWKVESDGVSYHKAELLPVTLSSGIDWLDLRGGIRFGSQTLSLGDLCEAVVQGKSQVDLPDGSVGVFPESGLDRWRLLASLSDSRGDCLRFGANQGWLLEVLLEDRCQEDLDRRWLRQREKIRSLDTLAPLPETSSFSGRLRDYQREALGWFAFLRDLGFGGCLADDMGLGKTVQVLALLDWRRRRKNRKPSLVVAPRSLTFNWAKEAETFTPELSVFEYGGPNREKDLPRLPEFDLVITTYGTLRRDALLLQDQEFDYVILDEAQAIKNSRSQAARASRLLRSSFRLALSGTPIENHLGELWSLFDFLNPGMLGQMGSLANATSQRGFDLGEEEAASLSRAIRPFFLRRTKQQVLKDLPPKTEQILYCEMGEQQREEYNDLRDFYRSSLLMRSPESAGKLSRTPQVLEALMRLRQMACHPGLVDSSRRGDESAKLDVLLPTLVDLRKGGHKALVFSQFTTLLGIVRKRLGDMGLDHEYLDGKTQDRQACVENFQSDGGPPFFLVSLKAGGVGLNLTAADYVFLLDPWWNPAVESQAIDRVHRSGQTRSVMAYRIVCRDTIEEKVLELSSRKRNLADSIIGNEGLTLSDLTLDDLESLLS